MLFRLGLIAANTARSSRRCIAPAMAMAVNHTSITGPKKAATRAVPRRCTANRPIRIATVTGRYTDVFIKEGGRWLFITWAGGDDPKKQ